MRLLADENFPRPLVRELQAEGHDVSWVPADYPTASDAEIIEIAERESRIILTIDKDLRQIATQRRVRLTNAGVVLFRVHPNTPSTLRPLVLFFRNSGRTWTGFVSTITTSGVGAISVREA